MKYLKATKKLDAEYRRTMGPLSKYPSMEKDIACARLPNGHQEAGRYSRDRKGKLLLIFPWLLSDMFSL